MAAKTGMAFDPEQVQVLSSALKALENNTSATLDKAEKCFEKLLGESIIGESAQKTPIIEAITGTDKSFVGVRDQLGRMGTAVDAVCEKLGVATSANIKTTADASASIHAQAQKVRENTGNQ